MDNICPACEKAYEHGGTSRLDNKTDLCGACCGMEALFLKSRGYSKRALMHIIWALMLRQRTQAPTFPKLCNLDED
jgi:hypothetical protein